MNSALTQAKQKTGTYYQFGVGTMMAYVGNLIKNKIVINKSREKQRLLTI